MAYKYSASLNDTMAKITAAIISGRDGISPIVSFESTDDGIVITVKDVEGEKSVTIPPADPEKIKEIVDDAFDEEMSEAEFYDLVTELPEEPEAGHIYVVKEDE